MELSSGYVFVLLLKKSENIIKFNKVAKEKVVYYNKGYVVTNAVNGGSPKIYSFNHLYNLEDLEKIWEQILSSMSYKYCYFYVPKDKLKQFNEIYSHLFYVEDKVIALRKEIEELTSKVKNSQDVLNQNKKMISFYQEKDTKDREHFESILKEMYQKQKYYNKLIKAREEADQEIKT